MSDSFYRQVINKSLAGYAYQRIICDIGGRPCDYEFIEVNPAFEALAGLKASDIIGKKITEIMPDIINKGFDWFDFYGDIAINGGKKEIEWFSEPLQCWYKVNVYSPEKYYFVTNFTDIDNEKKQLIKLDISHQRLANILEGTNVGTWEWNVKTGETIFNERWAEIIGYTLDEISPVSIKTWERFCHRDDFVKSNEQLKKIFTKETDCYDLECRMRHKDGSWAWAHDRGKVISWAHDGQPLWMSGTHTDITERKAAEIALVESKETLEAHIKNSFDVIFTLDKDGVFDFVSSAWERHFGHPISEVIGKNFALFVHPDDVAPCIEYLMRILTTGQSGMSPAFRVKNIDESWRLFTANGTSYTNSKGDIQFIGVGRDITESRNVEDALRSSLEKYRLITENVSDMISKHSLDGRYTFLSPSCKNILGYEPEELVGVNPYDLFHPESIQAIRKAHNTVLKSENIDISTYRIRRKDGSYIWLETSNKTIRDSVTNEPTEILCVSRDVSNKIEEENLFKKMVVFAEELLKTGHEQVTYHKILENLLYISKAKYGALTLLSESTGKFTTVEVAGMSDKAKKVGKMLGFELIGKEWNEYSTENEKLKGQVVSRFSSMSELVERVIPKMVSGPIEQFLNIGEVTVVKVIVNNQMIGDITLVMPAGRRFENEYLVEIYSRQIDMFITRIKAENKLKDSENRLMSAQIMARVGNWELNLRTKNIWASEEAFKIYGIERISQYLPLNFVQESVFPEYRESLDTALAGLISKKGKYDEEFKIKNIKTKEERFIHSKAELLVDEDGTAVKVIGTIQDITDYKKAEKEILHLSYHDQLTGLYNRRFYEEELKRLDTERNLPMTIAMGDVNGLKLINDSFGHAVGDELLKKVAEVIKKGCRADDIIARLGGDEFVIILPKTNALETEKVIKRIHDLSLKEKAGSIDISISFGYETKNKEKENIQEIFKNTEDNMYRHKLSESSSMRSKTIDLIMNTLFEKNNREMLHSKRVSQICKDISAMMNFSKEDINQIRITGLMHDIGKIGINENILNKPEKLTSDEWKEIERHSEIGYRILSSVNEFSEIADYVLEHHEKYNGKGYPRGLKGEEISLQARIISIADAFDAMTSERTYSKSLNEDEAVEEIMKCSGAHFDPVIAKIFVEKVLKRDWK